MKFFLVLVILASLYLFVIKKNSKEEPATSQRPTSSQTLGNNSGQPGNKSTPAPTPGAPNSNSNALKRPLDRTRAVVDQANKSRDGF